MPFARSKRTADPMISLSAVKKRRIAKDVGKDLVNEEAEETQERTTSTEIPQVTKFVENSLNVEEIEVAPAAPVAQMPKSGFKQYSSSVFNFLPIFFLYCKGYTYFYKSKGDHHVYCP